MEIIEQAQRITYHTVTLGAMTREGDVLAEIPALPAQDAQGSEQTRIIRVPAGLPGERVTLSLEQPPQRPPGRKKRHWKPRPPRVQIIEILQPSPLRVTAPCPVFGLCGGCQLQHMRYAAQLQWKYQIVSALLHEIGAFEHPPLRETIGCDLPWQYRNHMRFSVNRHAQPGLTAHGSRHVLPLTSCPIAAPPINQALAILSRQPNPRPQVLIRSSAATSQMLIQPYPAQEIVDELAALGIEARADTMHESLHGELFRIRPSSFFQTNTAQAQKMAQMVIDSLLDQANSQQARPLTIVDAYCGVATFALLLARHVGTVIAIEESPSAIKDAQWNLQDIQNVELLTGKVEHLLPAITQQLDGLVIDPPRAGCQQVVLDALIARPVPKIVYVSCDPATLARDLNILCHLQPVYNLQSVQPLDMFPQTAHIECIAVLEQR